MDDGKQLPASGAARQPKQRLIWIGGGTAAALLAAGLLIQYTHGPLTKAASDPPAGSAKVAPQGKRPEMLARVGEESITYDAVAEEAVKRYGREILDDLIHRLVIQQACEKNNITISEQEISDEINRIAKRFHLDTAQWLNMLQAERNITPTQYRQSVIFPLLAMKKLAGEEVELTEKDINESFVRNYGPRVKARMVMYDNQRRAQAGWEHLSKNPEDFEKVAAKDSVDPGSRALGGQIPPIPRYSGNEYLEALDKIAFKLKKEEISGVIEVSPSRYVILKCEGRTEPVVTDIEEVRNSLVDELKESKIQAEIARTFEKIKKDTIVDNYLTQTSNRPERTAGGAGGPGKVQPASGTQPTGEAQVKQNSSPARNPKSASQSGNSSRK